jgi:RNA polymerase sigma-70 factor (ECF subfamily)
VPTRNAYDALSETELLAAVLAKEPAAWPTFFARYERLVIGCVRKVLRRYHAQHSEEDIEDLISQTALNMINDDYRRLRAYDPTRGYKLSSWVGLIATNTAHDALRRRVPTDVWSATSIDDTDPSLDLPASNEPPEEAVARHDESRQLRQAVEALSPSDRLFVDYYFVQELEPETIARLLRISINTVYSRKNKIREKLRQLVRRKEQRSGKGDAPRA